MPISILIDYGVSDSYVNVNLVKKCKLVSSKFLKHIMVQLRYNNDKKITSVVKEFGFTMNGLYTMFDLDVIPLGLCDILIGMDRLESHHAILDCSGKIVHCLEEEGNTIQVTGILRPIYVR